MYILFGIRTLLHSSDNRRKHRHHGAVLAVLATSSEGGERAGEGREGGKEGRTSSPPQGGTKRYEICAFHSFFFYGSSYPFNASWGANQSGEEEEEEEEVCNHCTNARQSASRERGWGHKMRGGGATR